MNDARHAANDKMDSATNRRLQNPSRAQLIAQNAVSSLKNDICSSTCNNKQQYRVVLGLGPGRSGTRSFAELLASQMECIHSEHEMIVPRVYPRDESGRVDITSCFERQVDANSGEQKKGSWGADRRLEWDAPRLARGEPPRTEEEEALFRVVRLLEQRKVFDSWLNDAGGDQCKSKLGARGWKEHNAASGYAGDGASFAPDTNPTTIPVVCSVSSVGLAYVHEYIALDPSIRIAVLMRPRKQVVESFLHKSKGRNHWQKHQPKHQPKHAKSSGSNNEEYVQPDKTWDNAFPNMSDEECRVFMAAKDIKDAVTGKRPDKACALHAYWELYNDVCQELVQRYPSNVRIFDMDAALNDGCIQEDLLNWCGFVEPVLETGKAVHLNKKKILS